MTATGTQTCTPDREEAATAQTVPTSAAGGPTSTDRKPAEEDEKLKLLEEEIEDDEDDDDDDDDEEEELVMEEAAAIPLPTSRLTHTMPRGLPPTRQTNAPAPPPEVPFETEDENAHLLGE